MNLRQLYLKTVNKSIAFSASEKIAIASSAFTDEAALRLFRADGFASLKKAKSFNSAFY